MYVNVRDSELRICAYPEFNLRYLKLNYGDVHIRNSNFRYLKLNSGYVHIHNSNFRYLKFNFRYLKFGIKK